ncbi:MAG TPA: secretin N-terminal domain-containing protein [Blastocatellia bacterium]|nr:secretin N-terminal domain-containing protein [Blastocatellia bacterium]
MLTNAIKLIAIVAFALLLSPATFAQQNQPQNRQTESQFVDFSGFKGQIFDIKNRDPQELVRILHPLGSGFKGAMMQPNGEYRTITVRDFPENLATIAEAIKRLDVPLAPKPPRPTFPDIEVIAHILIASNNESAGNPSPPGLADVIKQLQMTLNYKNYQLLTSVVQRTKFENGSISANGTADMPDKSFSGKYMLQSAINPPPEKPTDLSQISFVNLLFDMEGFREDANRTYGVGNTKINTKLSVRDGEKVVVGTASLRDKAVILVLTTKILK